VRKVLQQDSYAYGLLLLLILVSLAFQLAAADAPGTRYVTILLQGATLLIALRISGAHLLLYRVAAIATTVALLGTGGLLAGSGDLGEDAGRAVALMLALLAPAAIAYGIVRDFRQVGGVTFHTMFGVLCIYLLLGMLFAFAFGLVGTLSDADFFAQGGKETQANFLYFSFTTITTTGYGDFTAGTDVGRSLAITEALIGQIYLVTVVAVIVSNLRRGLPAND
jgi:Ion channel